MENGRDMWAGRKARTGLGVDVRTGGREGPEHFPKALKLHVSSEFGVLH